MAAGATFLNSAPGSAVDISALNGILIAGHQGPSSITERAVHRLLNLQGVMRPHQIISLMQLLGASNTLALPDHADHIHVGWRALPGAAPRPGSVADAYGPTLESRTRPELPRSSGRS